MKTLKIVFSAFVIATLLTGCASMLPRKPYLPAGAKACLTDMQCGDGYVCAFQGVDQYASCKFVGYGYEMSPGQF